MHVERGNIIIPIETGYDYYALIPPEIGAETDLDDEDTMWGWIKHLRTKGWWTPEMEQEFIKLCKENI